MMNEIKAAFAWYSPEEYVRFQSAADDPEAWCEDYDSWKTKAEQTLGTLSLEGVAIVKIAMSLEAFEAWCEENGRENDGSARSQFAAEELQRRERPG